MRFIYFFRPFYYLMMNFFTFLLNLFIHRDKRIILFGSWYGTRFAGNSRFLFQYLVKHKNEYGLKKIIWVTRNNELYQELCGLHYETYKMHSFHSLYYHLKAGIHAINCNSDTSFATGTKRTGDIIGVLSLGAIHFFLNHAAGEAKGNKFSGYEFLNKKDKLLVDFYVFLTSFYIIKHFMLCAGGWDKTIFLAFGLYGIECDKLWHPKTDLKSIKYVPTGYPEFCKCLGYTESENKVINLLKGKKILLYVPTYRTRPSILYENPLDNNSFCAFLRRYDYFWVEKLHPGTSTNMSACTYDNDIALSLPSDFDFNIIMNYVTLFITDYSTSYMSAVFHNRPILFYTPDYDFYKRKDLGLLPEFDKRIKMEQACSVDELISGITRLDTGQISLQDKYVYIREKYPKNFNYKQICDDLFTVI